MAKQTKLRTELLLSYQKDWLSIPRYDATTGRANVKTLLKGRRIGGSYASMLDSIAMATGVDLATGKASEPLNVYVISATLRQGREWIQETTTTLRQLRRFSNRFDFVPKKTEINFPLTGRKITALASNPDSVRGSTGAIIVDEACFHQRFDEVWAAVKFVANPNLRDARGYPISLITTPWSEGTLQYDLFTSPKYNFIRQKVDIYDAVAAGFPIDPEEERINVGLDEIFATEHECRWLSGGSVFFPTQLLLNAYDEFPPKEVWEAPRYWGIDVGRTHDLTALVEMAYHGDTLWVLRVHTFRGMPIQEQVARMVALISNAPLVKVRIDRGLMGIAIVDGLKERFGPMIEGVDMSTDNQEGQLVHVKHLLERGRLKFNTSGESSEVAQIRATTTELSTLRAKPSTGAKTKFETPRGPGGHCDRAWALAIGIGVFKAKLPDQTGFGRIWEPPVNPINTY